MGRGHPSNDSSKLQGQSLVQTRSVCLGGYWREGAYRSYRLIKAADEKGNQCSRTIWGWEEVMVGKVGEREGALSLKGQGWERRETILLKKVSKNK